MAIEGYILDSQNLTEFIEFSFAKVNTIEHGVEVLCQKLPFS